MHEVTELVPPAAAVAGTVGGWLLARGAQVARRRHGGRHGRAVQATGGTGTSSVPSADDAGTAGRGGTP